MLKSIIKKLSSCMTAGLLCFSVVSACPGALIHANAEDGDPVETPVTETVNEPVTETSTEVQSEETPVVTEEPVETEESAESEETTVPEQPAEEAIPAETEEQPSEEQETAEPVTEETQEATTEETEPSDEIAVQEGTDEIAVEAAPASVATIDGTEYATLADAVTAAQNGQTIILSADVSESVAVSTKAITFDLNGKTWNGKGASTVTVSDNASLTVQNGTMTSQDGYRVITATDSTVTVNNVTLQGNGTGIENEKAGNGGIAYIQDTNFVMSGSKAINGHAYYGGGLFFENLTSNSEMSISLINSSFSGNDGKYGSAFCYSTKDNRYNNRIVDISIDGCNFENNTSSSAVFIDHGNLKTALTFNISIKNSSFTGNSSNKNGGALNINDTGSNKGVSVLDLENNTFTLNSTSYMYGGAVYVGTNVNTKSSNNTFTQNSSDTYGGAVAFYAKDNNGTKLYNNSEFISTGDVYTDNYCNGDSMNKMGGGAIIVTGYNATINNATIVNNKTVKGYGGGIFYKQNVLSNSTGKNLSVNGSTITGNSAVNGGAIANYGSGSLNLLADITLNGCNVNNNIATDKGGAVYAQATLNLNIIDSLIYANQAQGTGKNGNNYSGVGGGIFAIPNNSNGLNLNVSGSTHIYKNTSLNETKKIAFSNDTCGVSSDIAVYDYELKSAGKTVIYRTNLNFDSDDNKVLNTEESTYQLKQAEDQIVNTKQGSATKKYTYHVYYTDESVKPRIYISDSGSEHTNPNDKVVNNLNDAIEEAIANHVNKIYICNTVKIDSDLTLSDDVTYVRCENNKKAMFEVEAGATLTIQKGIFDGNLVEATNSMIEANAPQSSIVIDPTDHINSNVVFKNANAVGKTEGGAISLDTNTGHEFIMHGGTFECNSAYSGGAIYLFNTEAEITGGIFQLNNATEFGGALCAQYSRINIVDEENIAPVTFINNSVEYYGGALGLKNNVETLITAGVFTGNNSRTEYTDIAYYAGGAIYNEQTSKLTLKNVEIYNNKKTSSDEGSSTAQISNCPTGDIAIYADQGSLIHSDYSIDDVAFSIAGRKISATRYATVSDYAMGGGDYNWTPESDLSKNIYQNIGEKNTFRIKSHLSDESIAAGRQQRTVLIEGNYSYLAGTAIGNNGTLIIGSEKEELEVNKQWSDGNNNHNNDSVTVQLAKKYSDGRIELCSTDFRKDVIKVLNKENNWTGYWMDLGSDPESEWTVVEANTTDYQSTVSDRKKVADTSTEKNRYKVTLTNTPSKDLNDLVVTKNVLGDDTEKTFPFTVTVTLPENHGMLYTYTVNDGDQQIAYPDGNTLTINGDLANGGKIRINGLEAGTTYTVTEMEHTGYSVYVNGNKSDNAIVEGTMPENATTVSFRNVTTTSISVKKAWEDADDQDGLRPVSVTVKLFANGENTGKSAELNEENNWQSTFADLDAVDSSNNAISYTVEEEKVTGYTPTVSDIDRNNTYTITNTHIPETVKVEGTKTWNDDNNRDGKRVKKITVRLLADGKPATDKEGNPYIKTVVATDDWKYSFENLPKFRDHGTEIKYTVSEDTVEDYTTEINGYNITNTYTPGKTSVTVNKSWVDADNQDGMRPESVTVRLLADGVETDQTVELNADNNWQAIFTDLDEYKIGEVGQKVEYSVEEVNIPEGYEASVTGDATTGYTITNTHETEIINVSGQKTWNDLDNRFGKRPDNITVRLLADGNEIASQVVTADNNWAYTFADLPQYSAGKKIDYTVSEDAVPDYTTEINGYNITNTFETVRINGQKVWNDGNNASGRRPESITVQLLANGVQVAETTANADLDWFFSFGDLPVYENGEKIQYTVTETPVEGYRTNISGDSVNGFTVRNTARPETPRTNDDPKIEVPPTKPTTTTTVKRRPQTPFTGDTTDIAFYGGFAVAGLIVVLGIILFRRKEN